MQRTEKYFEKDAFRKSAAGVILAAEADATTGGGRIALDGTVFYPEGGGQPADRGTLTLADGTVLHVTDVHETGGAIWHTVDALPEAAQPGTAVTGGRGSVVGTLAGVLFMSVMKNGIVLLGIPSLWERAAVGLLIILSVKVDLMLEQNTLRRQQLQLSRQRDAAWAAKREGRAL